MFLMLGRLGIDLILMSVDMVPNAHVTSNKKYTTDQGILCGYNLALSLPGPLNGTHGPSTSVISK